MKHMRVCVLVAILTTMSVIAAGALAHGKGRHAGKAAELEHAAALGRPGDSKKVTRTIDVEMSDSMRFSPAKIELKRGETIRFRVTNVGHVKHEMVLGTLKELKEHAALMLKFPDMEHADPNEASVEPGQTGELIWEFTKSGEFDFACLQAGHFEAGMRGHLLVKR